MSEVLTVYILGPGFGESILIKFPSNKWMVIDCFRAGSDVPALKTLLEANASEVEGIILTHPHKDHAIAFHTIIDAFPDISWIGCVAPRIEGDRWEENLDSETVNRINSVRHTLRAIRDRWERFPEKKWDLLANDSRRIGDAILTILFPDKVTVKKKRKDGKSFNENQLSTPMLIEWKNVRLLLGAELPAEQWHYAQKISNCGKLSDHSFYKVSHHGSEKNHSEEIVGGGGAKNRVWVATPYNKGRKLPQFADGQGVYSILRCVDKLYLTSLPIKGLRLPSERLLSRKQISLDYSP